MKISILAPNKGPPFDEAWTKEVMYMSHLLDADVLCTGDSRGFNDKKYTIFRQGLIGSIRLLIHTTFNQSQYNHIHIAENPNTKNGKMITLLLWSGLLKKSKCSADFSSEWFDEMGGKGFFLNTFMKKIIPHLKFVNIKSDSTRRILNGLTKNIVFVMGIDIDKSKYVTPKRGSFNILFASAPTQRDELFIKRKGIDILLKAIGNIVKSGTDVKVRMLWRGSHKSDIESLIKSLKLSDNVKIIDKFVDINGQIAWSHITAFTPVDMKSSRNYPMSIIESIASGKPVVVSDILEISNVISCGKCGEVCKPNVESIEKSLQKCMKNHRKLSSNCMIVARNHFDIKKNIHDMKRFI